MGRLAQWRLLNRYASDFSCVCVKTPPFGGTPRSIITVLHGAGTTLHPQLKPCKKKNEGKGTRITRSSTFEPYLDVALLLAIFGQMHD